MHWFFPQPPVFHFLRNLFITPVLLKYEQTPLIQVVKAEDTSFTTEFSIYHPDATALAKVKGTQLYLTEAGKKAGLTLRHPDKMTVCELDGQTLFELRREGPAALHLQAELYAPDGAFVKTSQEELAIRAVSDLEAILQRYQISVHHNLYQGPVGVQVWANGRWSMAGITGGPRKQEKQPA